MSISAALRLLLTISGLLALAGCGGGGGSASTGCLGEFSSFSQSAVTTQSVSVSGVIEIESQTRIDSDTADDLRINQSTSNNCDDEAQRLPVTGVVGGYLSPLAGTYPARSGESTRFDFEQDSQDYFNADLNPGDRVSLQVFSDERLEAPRPRLQIFDGDNREVFVGALGDSQSILHVIESGSGDYTIRVSAQSGGPFRYVLIVAERNAESMMNTAYQNPDFVPGEAIVTFAGVNSNSDAPSSLTSSMSAESVRELRPGVWHLRQNEFKSLAAANRTLAKFKTAAWVQQLRNQAGVSAASPNYIYHAQTTSPQTNSLYGRQWNSTLISLPSAWQAAPNAGVGVGVAVLDTGLFSSTPDTAGNWHPDLEQNVRLVSTSSSSPDFVGLQNDLDNQPGRDSNPADPGDGQPRSSNFHGTHVAGIVSSVDNSIGVVGVAHRSDLIPVRVLGEAGTGNLADLIAAIEWAGNQAEIDVINLSLGGVAPNSQLENAINAAHNAGKLVVAAAGNQGTDEPTYPAAYPNVVGVGAVDAGGERASYSNVGASVSLVAPGGDASRDANLDTRADIIVSAWGTDDEGVFEPGYAGLQGTSMAAPHVSGLFALMKGEKPSLSSDEFFALMVGGQLTDAKENSTEYGAGLINAVKAVDAALDGNIPDVLAASPSVVTFVNNDSQIQLALNQYPTQANISIVGVSADAEWLRVGPELVAGEPAPSMVTLSINAALLGQSQSGTTELQIDYRGSGTVRSLTVPVNVRLSDPNDTRDAGRHYVLLLSADEARNTVYQQVVSAIGGQYRFEFGNVEPGNYLLVAGTDMDNNGFICENGEACAEYPVNGLPQIIEVQETELAGLRMSTSFRRPTINSLGGPRVGFEGYSLNSANSEMSEPTRRMEDSP